MPSRPPQNHGNLPPISPELAERISAFHSQGQMIVSGQELVRRGNEILKDVGCRGQLKPLRLPEPLRFVVVPSEAQLYVEVMSRRKLFRPAVWVPAATPEELEPHVLWPRGYSRPKLPVFVGNTQEIDYDSPDKDHWVYNNESRTARAGLFKGVSLIVRTVTEVEALYTKE